MTAEPLLKLAARSLARHRLDAVLIGNAAAALQGAPLTTVDLDFFIRRTPGNVRKVRRIADDLRASRRSRISSGARSPRTAPRIARSCPSFAER